MQSLLHSCLSKFASFVCVFCLAVPLANADVADDIEQCDRCHGEGGVSTESDVPNIAGISPFILEEYMYQYRDETRPCRESKYRSGDIEQPAADMCVIAQELEEGEIVELAEHYGSKALAYAKQDFDADKAARGAKVHRRDCEKCHSDGGSYTDDDAGILAGQWIPYLEQAFSDFASGEREMLDNKMKEKMDGLDAESISALMHYYASMQ